MSSAIRKGARWHLRLGLAAVLLFDLLFLSVTLSLEAPGPRALAGAPAALRALIGAPELVVPIGLFGLAALVRFATGPGRSGAGLGVIAAIGVLCEARAANHGGPERFLFAGGTVLAGWLAGIVFVRAGKGDRDAEEIGAERGAIAALAAIYVNAALQKLGASGLGWADGDDLRMLVLAQRPLGSSSADLIIEHRWVALGLAAFTELAQLSALAYPFHPRARMVIGTMLLAFHTGVRMLTPILFPQSMALLVLFSYPWGALLTRRGLLDDHPELVLVRQPGRGALVLGATAALLVAIAFLPPVRSVVLSLSHPDEIARRDAPAGETPRREPEPASFDASAASALGIEGLGAAVAGCAVTSVATAGDGAIALRLACGDGALAVEIVEAGSRPYPAPRRAAGRDLFYGSGATVSAAERDAVLAELARRLERAPR